MKDYHLKKLYIYNLHRRQTKSPPSKSRHLTDAELKVIIHGLSLVRTARSLASCTNDQLVLRKQNTLQTHAVYAAMMESMDTNVGRVLDSLVEMGIEDRTIICFMSDNGGLSTSEGSPTSNIPLRGGKGWIYEGGIREPYIIKSPDMQRPGSTSGFPVVSMDFYPTLLELAGLPLRSLAPSFGIGSDCSLPSWTVSRHGDV